jgi:hypothetical protein
LIDNKNQAMYGKALGRLGCGGQLHFDVDQHDWEEPRLLEISLGDEKILSLPVVGFDVQRQEAQLGVTRVTFTALEP